MSSPIHNDPFYPDDPDYYAPRRSHTEIKSPLAEQPSSPTALTTTGAWTAPVRNDEVIVPFPQPRDYLNGLEHGPRSAPRTKALVVLGVAAVVLTAGVALFGYPKFATPVNEQRLQEPAISLAARLQTAAVDIQKASQQAVTPTLTVKDSAGDTNSPLALGLEVKNYTPGAVVALSGLPVGTSISKGVAEPDGRWRVAASELPAARVIPPSGYSGVMTITAELRAANDLPIVRSPVRLTWQSRPAPVPAAASAASTQDVVTTKITKPDPPARHLDPKEAAALLRRAEELKAAGDIAAARLLLQRVAETNNARAAFELAETYDPIAMKKRGASSVAADPALAEYWYQRARDERLPAAGQEPEAIASRATAGSN